MSPHHSRWSPGNAALNCAFPRYRYLITVASRGFFSAGALVFAFAATVLPLRAAAYVPPASSRLSFNFNYDWKFIKQNIATGPEAVSYNDSAWKTVTLPHSWNDDKYREWVRTINDKREDPLIPGAGISYTGKTWYRKNFTLDAAWAGRKVFLEFEQIGRVANFYVNGQPAGLHENGVAPHGVDITNLVNFGANNVIAVNVNSDEQYHTVGYNGATIPYGTPFNNNYGGINANVTLHISDKLYNTLPLYRNLGTVGTYIYASNVNTLAKTAAVNIQAEVANDHPSARTVTCEAVVVDREGNAVLNLASATSQTIASGQKITFVMSANMTGIHFWSDVYPYLYKVYSIVKVNGVVADVSEIATGFRKVSFSAAGGLTINGHPLYLNGYAPRQPMEWPCVGIPTNWLYEYDYQLMKDSNANFLRPMHSAPKKAQVVAGDKFGVVMVVPAANNEGDQSDPDKWRQVVDIMRDVTIYFRNNPSVVFYEALNQSISAEHMTDIVNVRKTWDNYGNRFSGTRSNDSNVSQGIREFSSTMDGSGTQLFTPLWDAEYARAEGPRRVWDSYTPMLNPRWNGVNSDPTPAAGAVGDTTHKYILGGYFYIASTYHQALGLNGTAADAIGDYLTPLAGGGHPYFRLQGSEDMMLQNLAKYWGRYMRSAEVQGPTLSGSKGVMVGGAKILWNDSVTDGRMFDMEVVRTSGAVDAARLPKSTFYGLQVAHNRKPQVYVIGHWNYPAGTVKRVYVAGNTAQVKLQTFDAAGNLLTDYGFGRKDFFPTSAFGTAGDQVNNYVFAFDNVAWRPGTVRAIGYNAANAVVATHEYSTIGAPAALRLTPIVGPTGTWRADGSDVAMFDVEVVDAFGKRCPTFEDRVTFSCSGTGVFLGGYNSGRRYSTNLTNLTSGYSLNVECGINRVFVRSTRTAGSFTLNVTRAGLTSASSTITSQPIVVTNGLSTLRPQEYTIALGPEPSPMAEGTLPAPPPTTGTPVAPVANITDLGYTGSHSDAEIVPNVQSGATIYKDETAIFGTLPGYLLGGTFIRPYQGDAGENTSTDQYNFNTVRYSHIYQLIDAANDMPTHNDNETYQWTLLPETVTVRGRPMKIYKSRLMAPYENGYFATNGKNAVNFDPNSNMYLVFIVSAEQQLQKPTQTVTASSTQAPNVAANGIDGNVATRWSAGAATFPQTYTVDLGQPSSVGGYQINFYSAATRAYQYLIELSDDGSTYATSLDFRSNTATGVNDYRIPVTGKKTGRYVRVTVTGGSGWASFYELRINGIPFLMSSGPTPPPTGSAPVINSATSATATVGTAFSYQITATNTPLSFSAGGWPAGLGFNASTGLISGTPTASGTSTITLGATNANGTGNSTLALTVNAASSGDTNLALNQPSAASSSEANNGMAKANDGLANTRWAASAGAYPQWWMVDLGEVKTLSKIEIDWYNAAARSYKYKVEVSSDNTTFSTIVDKTGNTATGNTSDTLSTTGRFVRVTLTGVTPVGGFASAIEIRVLGPGTATAPAPTIASKVSRLVQGSAGTFDKAPTGATITEVRQGSPSGAYNVVVTFSAPVSGIAATLARQAGQSGTAVGTVSGVTYDATGRIVTIALSGVGNAQRLNIHLAGIQPGGGTADVPMNVLWGDVNNDGAVNILDLGQVRLRSGETVNASNCQFDSNADGAINVLDMGAARVNSGASLP